MTDAFKIREWWIDDVSSDSWYKKAAVHEQDIEKFVGKDVHVLEAAPMLAKVERLETTLDAIDNHIRQMRVDGIIDMKQMCVALKVISDGLK
jgi:hypothetical protein